MLETISNFLQKIGDGLQGLWTAGQQLFDILNSLFSSLYSFFTAIFHNATHNAHAIIPAPLIWVVFASCVIFAVKVIIGSSSNG